MAESTHTCPTCSSVFTDADIPLPPLESQSLVSQAMLQADSPIPETDVPSIRQFISAGRDRLSALNAKIAAVEATLEQLVRESDSIENAVRTHEWSISPLRRMPTEILSLIFVFTLPPHQTDVEHAPWDISAVCARWRAIVTSQARLWTTVYIDLDYVHPQYSDELLKTQLSRSGDLPLDVTISMEERPLEDTDSDSLQIICDHCRRWDVLSVSGPYLLYTAFDDCMEGPATILRELQAQVITERGFLPLHKVHAFGDTPLLKRVDIHSAPYLWSRPIDFVLPWPQLLQYSGSIAWDRHLFVLRSAGNLVECTLEIHEVSDVPQTLVLLPSLLRLSLSQSKFLDCLDTPALLELYCDYTPDVLPFLRRQSCPLQTLVLRSSHTPSALSALVPLIDAIPTITDLGLQASFTAQFAHELLSRPTFAPALQRISAIFPAYQFDEFADAVESRWRNGRLKSVEVHILPPVGTHIPPPAPPTPPYIAARIDQLRALGLEFLLSSRTAILELVPSKFRIHFDEDA
ncbi:hypothetical protein C8R46DRAFT_595986 [Mycena filopes]|nr:hypothetical protein C8R46DRAFT_595986 [Mycena filopes]